MKPTEDSAMTKPRITETQIRETAYLFWLDDGQPDGCDQQHWLRAIDALTPARPKEKPARKATPRRTAIRAATDAEPEAGASTAPATKKTRATKKPRATKASRATAAKAKSA
tara:strand:- start:1917 stop:2252 length:336 start_codon:yes stop_codon:yes gene_type:complete